MRHSTMGFPERSRSLLISKVKCDDGHCPVSQEPLIEKIDQLIPSHGESSSFEYRQVRSAVDTAAPTIFKMDAEI